jgi:tetratricopeptide (TPR) repeat protein
VAISILAYSNTFNAPFHLDDYPNIVNNPIIRDLSYYLEPSRAKVEGLTDSAQYPALINRYVGSLSFALNYSVHGLKVQGYHVFNVAVHVLNAFLVYLLVLLTFETPRMENCGSKITAVRIALFSALLFAVHPVQTQAVTYIVQRFASLAAMFYLLSLVLYVKFRSGDGKGHVIYALFLVSAALGMKTKGIALTLPVVVGLYEFLFFRERMKDRAMHIVPVFLIMMIIIISRANLGMIMGPLAGNASDAEMAGNILRLEYLLTELTVVVAYLVLLVLPIKQNLLYDYPVYHSFFVPQVVISFLFLAMFFGIGIYMLRLSRTGEVWLRLAAFGIFWFFITLSVESSIIPLHPIFEHRAYLPSVGIIIAAVSAIVILLERTSSLRLRTVGTAMLVAMVFLFSAASYARNGVWKSETGLWEDVAMKSPERADVHKRLGDAYFKEGRNKKAIKHYQNALRLEPEYADAHSNLGMAYKSEGDMDKAEDHFRLVIILKPDIAEAYNNLGSIYEARGLTTKALEYYENALGARPNFTEAHYNMDSILASRGMTDEAIKHYEMALKLNPDMAIGNA